MLLTADDLHCESLGCFGGKIADLTPNLDRLAAEGMRFYRAHVNVAICQPSRGVLATGRYGHNSGIMGFMHTDRDIPTIMETLRDAGYLTGVLGKVGHSTPKADYRWDFVHDQNELGAGRDPESYYQYCREFFQRCRREDKPFYFMVNSHDPHRPFHIPGKPIQGAVEPSRIYRPDEVPVPGFRARSAGRPRGTELLPELRAALRRHVRQGAAGVEGIRLRRSDAGDVPLRQRHRHPVCQVQRLLWPARARPGSCAGRASSNREAWIGSTSSPESTSFPRCWTRWSCPSPRGLDGRSFLPLLRGESQAGRDRVFTQIDKKAGGDAVPMRCVQDAVSATSSTPGATARTVYRNNNEGLTMKAMNEAAATDPIHRRARTHVPLPRAGGTVRPAAGSRLPAQSGRRSGTTGTGRRPAQAIGRSDGELDTIRCCQRLQHRDSPEQVNRVLRDVYGPRGANEGKEPAKRRKQAKPSRSRRD